jgi:hypothetical protein
MPPWEWAYRRRRWAGWGCPHELINDPDSRNCHGHLGRRHIGLPITCDLSSKADPAVRAPWSSSATTIARSSEARAIAAWEVVARIDVGLGPPNLGVGAGTVVDHHGGRGGWVCSGQHGEACAVAADAWEVAWLGCSCSAGDVGRAAWWATRWARHWRPQECAWRWWRVVGACGSGDLTHEGRRELMQSMSTPSRWCRAPGARACARWPQARVWRRSWYVGPMCQRVEGERSSRGK